MTATAQTYSAWANSLPTNEKHWAWIPLGVMVAYWMVAVCKSLLQQKMSAGERLRFSEMLDDQSDVIDAETIAAIQPAGPAELEIFSATAKADDKDKRGGKAYDLLGSPRLFDLLTAANPSVLDAIKANVARAKARANYIRVPQTTAPDGSLQPASGDGPELYHIHNVPTVTGGPASIYDAAARAGFPQDERTRFANGTPNNKPLNPFSGR